MSIRENIKTSVTFRLFIIGVLLVIFMIPTSMVNSLTHERERNSHTVIDEIASKWGRSQQIVGPILMVPYIHYQKTLEKDKKGNNSETITKVVQRAYFLPHKLNIDATVNPEVRYRNIYEAIVYKSDLKINGTFKIEDFDKWGIKKEDILFNEARFLFSVSDSRGIKEQVKLSFNDEIKQFEAGTLNELTSLFRGGIQSDVKASWENSFSFDIKLNGSASIMFTPFGKTTDVKVSSSWKDPSFTGAFLPDNKDISDKGFSASWRILDLNRGYPQSFLGDEITMLSANRAFGVEFHMMVDYYQKSERSIKYAMLFLSLTFLLFFFVEVFNKKKIHPFAYILVGFSLTLFFVLLLSFSEYIGFNYAYIVASIATIISITLYTKSLFKDSKFVKITLGLLVLLYAFMFTLLQLDEYALLIGSVMLFIVLSVVMYISRDIDWYNISTSES